MKSMRRMAPGVWWWRGPERLRAGGLCRWCAPFVLLLASACAGETPDVAVDSAAVEGDVLAMVAGQPITALDLEAALQETLSPATAAAMGSAERAEFLESVIRTRAIASVQEAAMAEEELALIDARLRARRDTVLARHYVRDNTPVPPVSEAQVRAEYERHPERYGAGQVRRYELVAGPSGLTGEGRAQLLQRMEAARGRSDWAAFAEEVRREGLSVELRAGEWPGAGVLDGRLAEAVEGQEVGGTGQIVMVGQRVYLVRVTAEENREARPMEEVHGRIRRSLAPVQAREAMRRAWESVQDRVDIERFGDRSEP